MKHLRYMEALLRHGHFGRAAEACHISQPALSIQIRELESMLGAPLIERGGRQIRPTPFGEAFAARASEILRSVDELADLARLHRSPFAAALRIGVIPTVAPYMLPAIIERLTALHPGLDLRPREAMTRTLIGELLEGRLEAAIVALPFSEASLVEHPLFEEEFVLIRPARDAQAPVPDGEALGRMRLLLLEEGHCFRDQSLVYCRLPTVRTGDIIEGSSLTTLVQLVGAGIGVTLIPEMAVAVELHSARVAMARLPEPRPRRTIGMIWRKSNPLADQLAKVAEVVRAVRPSSEGGC